MKKNLLLIFEIVIIFLRLLDLNNYINLFLGLLLIFFSILGISFLLKNKFHKEISKILPLSFIVLILFMMLCGFLGILKFGVFIFLIVSLILFNYYWYKDKYTFHFFTSKGLLFLEIMTIILLFANYMMVFNISDEYTFWSIISKHMYYSDSFTLDKINFMHCDGILYPPSPTVLYYYCFKLIGFYRQGLELLFLQIFSLSLLTPLFSKILGKISRILLAIILLFICSIFCDSYFWLTIYVDVLQGLLCGFCIYSILEENDTKFGKLCLVLSLVLLGFTKSSGFMFTTSVLVFYFIFIFLKRYDSKCSLFKNFVMFFKGNLMYRLLVVLCSFGPRLFWNFYISKFDIIDKQTYLKNMYVDIISPHTLSGIKDFFSSFIGLITGYNYDAGSKVMENFVDKLLLKRYYSIAPVELNSLTWIIIFLFIMCIIYWGLSKDKNSKNYIKCASISLFISVFVYYILLELAYLFVFSKSEALLCNSAQRYVGAILTSTLFVLCYLIIANLPKNKLKMGITFLFIGLLLFTPIQFVFKGTIFAGSRNREYRGYEAKEMNLANIISKTVKSGSKVGIINQGENNFSLKVVYWSIPVKVYNSQIFNEENIDLDVIDKIRSYDYIVVIESNEYMDSLTNLYFHTCLKKWSLYKVSGNSLIYINSIDEQLLSL